MKSAVALPRFTFRVKDSLVLRQLRSLLGLFPLTLRGSLTLLVTASALSIWGYGAMDLMVFALAICALSILLFCLFCSVISGVVIQRRVQRSLQDSPLNRIGISAEAGFPNETGFVLDALRWFPLIRLEWRIIYPDQVETRTLSSDASMLLEEIIPHRRCLTDSVRRQFTVADILGFCRYSWYQRNPAPCLILPRVDSLKSLPLLRSLTAEDGIPNPGGEPEGDRMEIRRYAPGDSVRNIMWKNYARNRQLNVRLPERSVMHSQRTIAYLLSSREDEAAAAVARMALENGALGEDWEFGADGSREASTDVPSALRAVARSRAIDRLHAYGLDAFLEQRQALSGVHCILFGAAKDPHWLTSLKATLGRLKGQVSLVLAMDGLREPTPRALWRRLLLRDNGEKAGGEVEKAELLGLLTDLGQLVESIVLIDRQSGVSYDRNLRKL